MLSVSADVIKLLTLYLCEKSHSNMLSVIFSNQNGKARSKKSPDSEGVMTHCMMSHHGAYK